MTDTTHGSNAPYPQPMSDQTPIALLLDIGSRLGRVEGQNDEILKAQGRAEESRKGLHEKVDGVNQRLTACESGLTEVRKDIDQLSPIVDELQANWHRAQGSKQHSRAVAEFLHRMWSLTIVRIACSAAMVTALGWLGIKITK